MEEDLAKTIKANVSIPVIAVNNINIQKLQKITRDRRLRLCGIGRCHLTDPEYVNKAKANDTEAIRKCIGCLYCFKVANEGKQIACTINPRLGREFIYNEDTIKRNGDGRKVAVIGGGQVV